MRSKCPDGRRVLTGGGLGLPKGPQGRAGKVSRRTAVMSAGVSSRWQDFLCSVTNSVRACCSCGEGGMLSTDMD